MCLREFRARLIAGAQEQVLFDKVLAHLRAQGLRHPRAGDNGPTPRLCWARFAPANRLEFVIETMRHALNTLAVVAPDWIRTHVPAEWVLRYDHRAEDYRLPQADQERIAPHRSGRTGWSAPPGLDWRKGKGTTGYITCPPCEPLRQVWEEQYAGPPRVAALAPKARPARANAAHL